MWSGNHNNQKPQVAETNRENCGTANRVLGFIARNFNYKSTELILQLYKSLVRPSPRIYCTVHFWSPHLHRDIDKMERVQRRATKMIPEIRNHSYQQRLKDLKLMNLVQRRLWGQLIEVFKYLNMSLRKKRGTNWLRVLSLASNWCQCDSVISKTQKHVSETLTQFWMS